MNKCDFLHRDSPLLTLLVTFIDINSVSLIHWIIFNWPYKAANCKILLPLWRVQKREMLINFATHKLFANIYHIHPLIFSTGIQNQLTEAAVPWYQELMSHQRQQKSMQPSSITIQITYCNNIWIELAAVAYMVSNNEIVVSLYRN